MLGQHHNAPSNARSSLKSPVRDERAVAQHVSAGDEITETSAEFRQERHHRMSSLTGLDSFSLALTRHSRAGLLLLRPCGTSQFELNLLAATFTTVSLSFSRQP